MAEEWVHPYTYDDLNEDVRAKAEEVREACDNARGAISKLLMLSGPYWREIRPQVEESLREALFAATVIRDHMLAGVADSLLIMGHKRDSLHHCKNCNADFAFEEALFTADKRIHCPDCASAEVETCGR